MIKLKLSPITCPNPELLVKCNPENEENPMSRLFSVRETPKFDGDIYMDHELKLDEQNYITKYLTWISYKPSKENKKEFHIDDLPKLKEIISKVIIGDM